MAREIALEPCKTYASAENARKAVLKVVPEDRLPQLKYFIHQNAEGRFFPVFIGESALQNNIHFSFCVVG